MSEENVELMRRLYDAWNRDDHEFQLQHAAPDFEFHLPRKIPGLQMVYKGHDGVRQWVKDWREMWETMENVVDRIIDVDDERVLGLVHLRGVGRSGIETDIEYAHLVTIRDGLVVRNYGFVGWQSALEAAGIDE